MSSFYIIGGNQLNGEVNIDCAKNSLLPILACSIMTESEVVLKDVPQYSDVLAMCNIIKHLGGVVEWNENNLIINCSTLSRCDVPNELASVVRSSIFTLGPILARMKKAKVSYPGGCDIGLRPIDIHLSAIKQLGGKVVEKNGYIYADSQNISGKNILLSFPSVGATENAMMLASLIDGETKIINPAREPEIIDLQNFINCSGGFVHGAGTNEIIVQGVKKLHGCCYKCIPDRIETGTFMIAVAMCGGKVVINNAIENHNQELISKLNKSACKISSFSDKIIIEMKKRPISFGDVETAVYPGFPTDLQAQMMSLAAVSKGYSLIVENLFEGRFKHAGELLKMGCDIKFKNGVCIINGKDKIYGADVTSTDLRGGASLVLAGLKAEGYTTITNIDLIDRGYFHFENKLQQLGANIKRVT